MNAGRPATFDPHSLDGRVAVVTGASGGLGGAIAARLRSMGATVVPLDLQKAFVPDAPASLSLACDISDEKSVSDAAHLIEQTFGSCDILVNNAAILPAPVRLEDVSVNLWDRVLATNLRGPFLCAKYFGRSMLAQERGSIVNVASIAATTPNTSGPYGPSKAAVLALTRQISVEWGPRGVRANSVSPGLVHSPMSEHLYRDPAIHTARRSAVASRRIGSPDELADVIAFLASDASSYINGQEVIVDGGLLSTTLSRLQSATQCQGTA